MIRPIPIIADSHNNLPHLSNTSFGTIDWQICGSNTPLQFSPGQVINVGLSWILAVTCLPMQSVQKTWEQLLLANISVHGFHSMQISQKLVDDWAMLEPELLLCVTTTVRALVGVVTLRARVDMWEAMSSTDDMMHSWSCNSSAYRSSEMGRSSSWSIRMEK